MSMYILWSEQGKKKTEKEGESGETEGTMKLKRRKKNEGIEGVIR